MTNSIYTSVNNANIVPCGKRGKPIRTEPIPLLRDKYLGEYRTELEKAKVRKNLGIADDLNLQWGNITGFLESQTDLINYIATKLAYSNSLDENIKDVQSALDYAFYFINNYKVNDEAVNSVSERIQAILSLIDQTIIPTSETQAEAISGLQNSIVDIDNQIQDLNAALLVINVDANILAWVKAKLENSKTIELKDDTTLHVVLDANDKNAISAENGLFVYDFTEEIENLTELLENIQSDIQEMQNDFVYNTELDDSITSTSQVGGVSIGTPVSSLKGKTFSEIIDSMFFPTVSRNPILPTVSFNMGDSLVEYGTPVYEPVLTFVKNDAGNVISETNEIKYQGSLYNNANYNSIGTFIHTGVVNYEAGEYIIDNKGNQTNKRIEAGNVSTQFTVTVTHPWYAGQEGNISKQTLIPFNQQSGNITIVLSGKAQIKLPGLNTQLTLFQVDGGMGFLNVDITGWTESNELINGIYYKVWTKNDSYSSILLHKLNFILRQ